MNDTEFFRNYGPYSVCHMECLSGLVRRLKRLRRGCGHVVVAYVYDLLTANRSKTGRVDVLLVLPSEYQLFYTL